MKRYLKQVICLLLTAVMLFSALPTQAFAVFEPRVMLPQVELEEEILQNDVFFLGTVSAEVEENGDCAYLLRVGRGCHRSRPGRRGPGGTEQQHVSGRADPYAGLAPHRKKAYPHSRDGHGAPEGGRLLLHGYRI